MFPHAPLSPILLPRATSLHEAPATHTHSQQSLQNTSETYIAHALADAARHVTAQRQHLLCLPNELLYTVAQMLDDTDVASTLAQLYRTCHILQILVQKNIYSKFAWEFRGSENREERKSFDRPVEA
jgi:hypothetical protein